MSIFRLMDRMEARESGLDPRNYFLRMTDLGQLWLFRSLATWHMDPGQEIRFRPFQLFGFPIITDNNLSLYREWLLTTSDGRIVYRGEFEACHCGRAVYEWFPDRTSNGLCPECIFRACDNDPRVCGFKHGAYE